MCAAYLAHLILLHWMIIFDNEVERIFGSQRNEEVTGEK
jgi:hypothetical protein